MPVDLYQTSVSHLEDVELRDKIIRIKHVHGYSGC